MNKFRVVVSETAQQDLRDLSEVISYQYKAPLTSLRYLKGIYAEMHKLSVSATSYKVQMHKSLQQYAPSPRIINYKRIAIIFNIINNVVFIRRVIPSSAITII